MVNLEGMDDEGMPTFDGEDFEVVCVSCGCFSWEEHADWCEYYNMPETNFIDEEYGSIDCE